MNYSFCHGEIKELVFDRLSSYHPLLKTVKNQEHDNANMHPPFPKIIEQLVEQIIHYVSM